MLQKIVLFAVITGTIIMTSCNESGKQNNSDGYVLKFNMDKGAKFDFSMTMDLHMQQLVMGKSVDVINKILMGYTFEVIGNNGGWKKINATISRIAADMVAGDTIMHFDSNEPDTITVADANPMAMAGKVMGAIKGGQFGFEINEKGEIGVVYGLNEMMQRMVTNVNLPDAAAILRSIRTSFDEESFRQNMQQSFNIYPGKPVRTGESWNKTMTIRKSSMDMKLDNTYTLRSVTGTDAFVTTVSAITSADTTGTGGMNMGLTGNMNGTMHYNLVTGMPVQGDMSMNLDMKVTGRGMEIPVNMDIKMLFEGKQL